MRSIFSAVLASLWFVIPAAVSARAAAPPAAGTFIKNELHAQTQARNGMLAALNDTQRDEVARIIGIYATSNDPNFQATATTIDDMLTAPQQQRIIEIERNLMRRSADQMRSSFPKSRSCALTPTDIDAILHASRAGEWLLITLMTSTLGTNLPLTHAEFQQIGEGLGQLPGCMK